MLKKRYRRPKNPLKRYYIAQVAPVIVAFLCVPLLPGSFPLGGAAVSRYVLLILPILIFLLGLFANRALGHATAKDGRLRQEGKDEEALHASTVLQLSIMLLLFLGMVSLALLFVAGYQAGLVFSIGGAVYQQILAVAVSLTLCFYGYFLPLVPYGHVMGIQTKHSLSSPDAWRACHMRCGKVLLVGGGVLALFTEFIPFTGLVLGLTAAAVVALLALCYGALCKGTAKGK